MGSSPKAGSQGGGPAAAASASRGRCRASQDRCSARAAAAARASYCVPEPPPARRDTSPAETHEFPSGNCPSRFDKKGWPMRETVGGKSSHRFKTAFTR